MTRNRCPLCGAATRRDYCYAHSWAGYDTPKTASASAESPSVLSDNVVPMKTRSYADGWKARGEYEAQRRAQ